MVIERRQSQTKVNKIESVGGTESWFEYFMVDFSIFGLTFGVFIKNGTRYVSKFSTVNTVVYYITLIWVVVSASNQIGSVDFCCNIIQEKPDNQTYSIFNVQKPGGVQSWIDNNDLPKNKTLLFPL